MQIKFSLPLLRASLSDHLRNEVRSLPFSCNPDMVPKSRGTLMPPSYSSEEKSRLRSDNKNVLRVSSIIVVEIWNGFPQHFRRRISRNPKAKNRNTDDRMYILKICTPPKTRTSYELSLNELVLLYSKPDAHC